MSGPSPVVRPNPDVLRWARQSAGWEINEISTKVGVDVSTYKKWESGHLPARLTTLEELANHFKRPLAAFFLPKPPKEAPPPTDFRFLPRRRGRFDRKTILAIRRAQRSQAIAGTLMDELQRSAEPQIELAKVSDDPEEIGSRERKNLSISLEQQSHWKTEGQAFEGWREAIERNNVLVYRLGMPVDDARGFSLISQAPFAIVVSASDSITARIFTLMHEYGHLLLRTPGVCIPQKIRRRGVSATDVELWCNRFAAAVLVPRSFFNTTLNLKAITQSHRELAAYLAKSARTLHVSRQVILRRMFDLALIPKKRFNQEMGPLVASGKKSKPRGGPTPDIKSLAENGRLFTQLVFMSRERGLLTTRDAADYLSVPAKYLGRIQDLVAA